ncbi:RNA polymerase sigma factor [Albibacterium sp.]|uniref:RNA polymerase sigma factor n=1 Tax=Albibacterium sp. TaxID=2952885 RepID=UPI002C7BDCD7|nr:RNA polymerase sigma factor [Albibacterium sp.]HUH19023.1 RNA polymerase sigma factor [Albibacterium sp.]
MSEPVVISRDEHVPNLFWAINACARNNDERAKELIYRKLYGYINAVISRYIKDIHDTEELVNETFIKAFKAIHTFSYTEIEEEKVEKFFYGWLGRIAANLSIDHLRSKKRLRLKDDNVSEADLRKVYIAPVNNLEVQDILKLMDQLPDVQRIIFNLYEVEGFSHQEIGQQLKIPESTSRTYLTRAKQKLRSLYSQLMDIDKKNN